MKEDPKNPAIRYLLAQCYREEAGSEFGPLPPIDKAQELLKALVHDYPQVADYRFELADTCAMLDVRDLPPDDFPQAERRLRAASSKVPISWTATPMRQTISVCTSTFCTSWLAFSATRPPSVANPTSPAWTKPGSSIKRRSAARLGLSNGFPTTRPTAIGWRVIRMSSATFLLERRQPEEARNVLESAVAETEKYFQAHANATSLRPVLHELYARLFEARGRLDDDKGARRSEEEGGANSGTTVARPSGR